MAQNIATPQSAGASTRSNPCAAVAAVPHKGRYVDTPLGVDPRPEPAFEGLVEGLLLEYGPLTTAAYARDLDCYSRWCTSRGLTPLESRRVDIAAYLQALRQRGYAQSTIGRRLACLRAFYCYPVEEQVIDRSPAAAVRWRQDDPLPRRALSAEELGRLLLQHLGAAGPCRSRPIGSVPRAPHVGAAGAGLTVRSDSSKWPPRNPRLARFHRIQTTAVPGWVIPRRGRAGICEICWVLRRTPGRYICSVAVSKTSKTPPATPTQPPPATTGPRKHTPPTQSHGCCPPSGHPR